MKVTKIMKSTIMNVDCMEYMRSLPDKFFDLAVVDPPYGIGNKYRDWETDRKSTRLNSSHSGESRMPSSA